MADNEQKATSKRNFFLVITLALAFRVITWYFLPMDWNWDSYHHWQISYLSLKIGFTHGRLWDLSGCEYYWGVFPHIIEAVIMSLLNTSNITPYRLLNMALGSLNAGLVYLNGTRYNNPRVGLWAGVAYSVFPISGIFDILALQDTMALTFLLASIYLLKTRPFFSGIFLALAGQSRTELIIVGLTIVIWVMAVERLKTEKIPVLVGWMVTTGVFGWHIYCNTGNPFYSLYWNLSNVFSQGDSVEGTFLSLACSWVKWKLTVWPTKPTGIIILFTLLSTGFYFIYTVAKRKLIYQTMFFLTTAVVTLPIFLTYIGGNSRLFLIMVRAASPTVALGLPILTIVINKFKAQLIGPFLISIFLISYFLLLPAYIPFQGECLKTLRIVDDIRPLYPGGSIVCDYPMMNYRFINGWRLPLNALLSNHYAPHYYGYSEPFDYVKWIAENRVSTWVRYGGDSEIVYDAIQKASGRLLIKVYEDSGIKIYSVDKLELLRLLR